METNESFLQPFSSNNAERSFMANNRGNLNGGGNNPLAALSLIQNPGTFGSPHNPIGRGPIHPNETPKGLTISRGAHLPSRYPLTPPITSKEGEEAHDATNIVFQVGAWNPNVDEQNFNTHLEPGDPVFVAPTTKSTLVEMFNPGQLNKILRDGYRRVMEQVLYEKDIGGKATAFMKLLADFGEGSIETYHTHKQAGTLKLMFNGEEEKRSQIKELHRLATSDEFYYMTCFGVSDRWKFVGFVLTTSDPLRIKGSQRLNYARQLSVNVTVRGEIQRALNLWGGYSETDSCSKLYFILNKIKSNTGYGSFQFVPYGSRNRASIPRSQLLYRDSFGMLRPGSVTYVGYIQLPSKRKTVSAPTKLMASGLIADTFDKIREAAASLQKIRIEVKMR